MNRFLHCSRVALAGALAAALLLAGCGDKASASSPLAIDSAGAISEYSTEMSADSATVNAAPGVDWNTAATGETSRKIVYNADLSLESKAFDAASQALTAAVTAAGGYLESSSLSGSAEQGDRWASYTARIPAENYRGFLQAAGSAANLVRQNEYAQDITTGYIDVQARLTALTTQRDRLNQLADKAETTADLLEIESQLSDVQYQLENYTQQLRAMDDQLQYSTVTMDLTEVATLTPTSAGFAARILHAFTGGWAAFGRALQEIAVLAVFLLPLLLVAALGTLLGRMLYRRHRAKHPKAPKTPKAPKSPKTAKSADATNPSVPDAPIDPAEKGQP